jgi:glycosyltransferase involved in cell wall biosynthesis
MRIAQVAPLFESVPPTLYGGTERVVSWLTEELVRQGHDVTLFASGDSETSAQLVPACPRALWRDPDCRETLPQHVGLVELVARQAHRFDVIHFHLDYIHFPTVGRLPCPTVTTLHCRLHPHDQQPFFEAFPHVPLVSISDDQRKPIPNANWVATVYHGMPRDLHTYRDEPGSYLAFLGRLSPEKGIESAVEIARRSGMPLRVAAKIYPEERPYYESVVEPMFRASPSVDFVGEVGGLAKDEFIGNAHALLFPIAWDEPFGLVMIEAMACGTPVVAYRRGSVPEIVEHETTGFIVDDVNSAVNAVARVRWLSRRDCRRAFERRFDDARMTRGYVEVYCNVAADASAHPRRFVAGTKVRRPARPASSLLGPMTRCGQPVGAPWTATP